MENTILNEAKLLSNEIIEHYEFLHKNAEIGFDLQKTKKYVKDKLTDMGYTPKECGKCGIVATIGKYGKVFLLRADMDALPMKEETTLPYKCENGNMHSCGHDTHTAMLLGAAKLLKKYENKINGTVKLMFQPSEENLEGAIDMVNSGVLENPKADAAMMIHSITGIPLESGTVIVAGKGVSSPAADYFTINITGKASHGSTPQLGIDALNVASHILVAIQEITARELGIQSNSVITIGRLTGGDAGNVIAHTAVMEGTIRAFDEKTRLFIKKRIAEISSSIATAFRAKSDIVFGAGCPTLINDASLSEFVSSETKALLGERNAITTVELGSNFSGGSDDFAYVSHKVPSIMLSLVAGDKRNGYEYTQHHPKAVFDNSVLYIGSAVYFNTALKWLTENVNR